MSEKTLRELKFQLKMHLNHGRGEHTYAYDNEETGIGYAKRNSRKTGQEVVFQYGNEVWHDLEKFRAAMEERGVVAKE